MTKKIRWAAVVMIMAAATLGAIVLQPTPANAAGSKCWQVDCNTCCRGAHGVVCTQRACP